MPFIVPPDREDETRLFIHTRGGIPVPKGPTQVLGFMDDQDEIIAGVMFERYTGVTGSVHVHWAAKPSTIWLTRTVLYAIATYTYGQMGVGRLFGEVRASDEYVRKVDEKLGFRKVAVLEGYFPGDDLVLYSMTKAECRWLPPELKETSFG